MEWARRGEKIWKKEYNVFFTFDKDRISILRKFWPAPTEIVLHDVIIAMLLLYYNAIPLPR